MNHDDNEDLLANIPLHTWHVPPPSAVDRASLLARSLAPAAAPRRFRGTWMFAALALANVVLATIIVIIVVQRPSQPTVTVRPAGGGSIDSQTVDLLLKLSQEQHELEAKLAEIQQLRTDVEQLAQKARDCDETVKHDKPPVVTPPVVTPPVTPLPPRPTPTPTTPEITSCDEVSCVLNNYEGTCCAKYHKVPGLPETLDRAAISSGIAAVKAQVAACGGSVKGIVKLHVRVAPSGKVTNVDVASTPEAALGGCVAAAAQKASFPATQQGGSFSYPFVF